MSGQILFNYIPGTGLVEGGTFFEVNSGGQYAPVNRFILIGFKTGAGVMATDVAIPVASQQQVDQLAGPGSMLREMYRVAVQNSPVLPIWIMAPSGNDTGLTKAVNTITIAGSLVVGQGTFEFCGETIQIPVGPTDTPTTIATAIAAAINNYYNPLTGAMLPATATSSAGVVTWTARNGGITGNEIDVWVNPKILGNVFAISGVWTAAQSTAGAGSPTGNAAALAALGDSPADVVVCPFSDSTSLSSYTSWANDNSGRWSWDRQSYGHVWCAAVNTYSGLTTLGGSTNNDRHTTVLGCFSPGANGTPHGSWLWIAAFAALTAPWLFDITTGNVNRAQLGLVVQGIRPPRDASVIPTYTARNSLVQTAISTWIVNAAGQVCVSKIVTTYLTGLSGQPDTTFRNVQAMYAIAGGLAFLRAGLATMFGQRSLAQSNPGNLGAIVTPSDIKGGFISLYSQLANQGVFADPATFASLLQVQINATNPDRVDVFCPVELVNPFDILAANATFYQQYPPQPAQVALAA